MEETTENTYKMTEKEICVINAMACYFSSVPIETTGMTKEAYNTVSKIFDQLKLNDAIGNFQVWE